MEAEAAKFIGAGLDVPVPRPPRPVAPPAPRTPPPPSRGGMRLVQVNVGHRDGLVVANLVRLLRAATGLPARAFGAIEIRPHSSTFEVRADEAERIAGLLEGHPFGDGLIKARPLASGPSRPLPPPPRSPGRPARGPRAEHPGRPPRGPRSDWRK